MSHVLESQVPVADGQRAERLPQRWLPRLLCPGLSFPGRAPPFRDGPPLSSSACHSSVGPRAGGGEQGWRVRLAQKWAVSTFGRGCFSNCGRSGLHGGPARGESAVVRITVGSPPSTAGSGTAPACCWGDLGQAGLLLAGLHPIHMQPLQQGGGFPPFSGQDSSADAVGALPKAPQHPVPQVRPQLPSGGQELSPGLSKLARGN